MKLASLRCYLPVIAFVACFYLTDAEAAVFDVSTGFSTNANPGGVWSYGYKTNLSSGFNLFTFSKFSPADNGLQVFDWAKNTYEPSAVYFNPTTNTATSGGGTGIYPPGTVWFYPGVEGHGDNYGAIRFTTPGVGGVYKLETAVQSPYVASVAGDTDFHVVLNGSELFGRFLATNAPAGYTNTVLLNPGDVIDFLVGRGADGMLYNSGLKIQATLTLVTNGVTNVAPMITRQPESRSVVAGGMAYFTVNASGTSPLSFQWRKNGSNIWGAVNASLVLSNVQPSDAGTYSVVVSNWVRSVASSNATLAVLVSVRITSQPQSQSLMAGHSATFSVGASGTAPLRYQWRKNGANIDGAVDDSLTLDNVQPADVGVYSVVISNVVGALASSNANLSVTIVTNGAVYDISRGFSINQNRNGPWSFGSKTEPRGSLSLFSSRASRLADNRVLLQGWNNGELFPGVYFNPSTRSSAVLHDSRGVSGVIPPRTLVYSAGRDGRRENYTAARFTVPARGAAVYRIETAVKSLYPDNLSGDTDFHVLLNGVEIFGRWLAANSSATYTNTMPLRSLDTIDFLVGRGADRKQLDSELKLQAVLIALTNIVYLPEPGDSGNRGLSLSPKPESSLKIQSVAGNGSGSMSGKGFTMSVTGEAGNRYSIQASTNLIDWIPITTVTNVNGAIDFSDPAVTNLPSRFYRAIRLP